MPGLNGMLERFYREHRQQLFTCALAVTRCADRAEDAVQEAFCRLLRLERAPRHLKAYVFRAVRNAALDQVRGGGRPALEADESIFAPGSGPRDQAAGHELQRRVAEALAALSDDERETVVQRLYGDLTFREIAEIRQTPLGTVAAWYHRGLQKLRARLEE